MNKKRKKGFTLVELLAVIAILGLILIIAVPKVMDTMENSKKRTLELTARSIIKSAEEAYIENISYGLNEEITCESVTNITNSDYESCELTFDDEGNASITLIGKGRYDGLSVCEGTKENITVSKGNCTFSCNTGEIVVESLNITKPYLVKNVSECSSYITDIAKQIGDTDEVDSQIIANLVSLCNGQTVEGMDFNDFMTNLIAVNFITEVDLLKNDVIVTTEKKECIDISNNKGLNCTYNGKLYPGVEFTDNQYTYRYRQEYNLDLANEIYGWKDIEEDGWGVTLTNKSSENPVNTQICSYINGKPLVSTSYMLSGYDYSTSSFTYGKTTSIDVSSWDTDNVVNMGGMFMGGGLGLNSLQIIGLSNLETSNVTDMSYMFSTSDIESLDLSNFDTSKVTNMRGMFGGMLSIDTLNLSTFNTSKVTDMSEMFYETPVKTIIFPNNWTTGENANLNSMFFNCPYLTSLDLSGFDTSKVTNMDSMLTNTSLTTGYARTQADADRLNASSGKPEGLTFTVKNSN